MVLWDFLSPCVITVCFSLPQDVAISPRQRDEVIQWLAKLKYQFHLYPETLALAISLLDRFLAAVKVNICSSTDGNRFLALPHCWCVQSERCGRTEVLPSPGTRPCPAHRGVGSTCSAPEPDPGAGRLGTQRPVPA